MCLPLKYIFKMYGKKKISDRMNRCQMIKSIKGKTNGFNCVYGFCIDAFT